MASVNAEEIGRLVAPFVGRTGGPISALRAVLGAYGHIPHQCDAVVAQTFNLSRAEVRGIISFYADFCRQPKGRTVVRLCAAEACQAAGGRALQNEVESRLGLQVGQTGPSGDISLERVFCLGLCSVAPAALVNDALVGRADAGRIEAAIARAKNAVTT